MTNTPSPRWLVRASVVAFAVACGLVVFACSDDNSFVSLGPSARGVDAGPVFVPPDEAGTKEAGAPALLCVTSECPAPFRTCPVADDVGDPLHAPMYTCGTDLSNDAQNCGTCGNACAGQGSQGVLTSCVDGVCRATCYNFSLDCNGLLDDGCEVSPNDDPKNCGRCGNECAPGVECIQGQCGCPPGFTDCNGICYDLTRNDDNCGACDYNCDDHPVGDAAAPPPHMRHGCKESKCTELHCVPPDFEIWENCNGSLVDGCEINVAGDVNNCATCGTKCAPGQQCFSDPAAPGIACQCPAGKVQCGDVLTCVDLESDVSNCGACGFGCPDPVTNVTTDENGQITCDRGRCGYRCKPGFADCDGRPEDGCEAEISKDPRNCGGCGITCDIAANQPCVNGQCVTAECDAGGATR